MELDQVELNRAMQMSRLCIVRNSCSKTTVVQLAKIIWGRGFFHIQLLLMLLARGRDGYCEKVMVLEKWQGRVRALRSA